MATKDLLTKSAGQAEEQGRFRRIGSAERCTFAAGQVTSRGKPSPKRGLAPSPDLRSNHKSWSFTVSYHCAQLAWQEMVRWPRAADRHFAVFQLLGGGA